MNAEQIPVGNPIDPDFYFPGPGDVIALQSLPILKQEKYLTVSPEKSIILPRFGDMNINGMTLSDIKDTLEILFNKRNPNSETSVTLKRPRACLVQIRGNVKFPSTYALPSSYRVSTAILAANYKSSSQIPIPQYSALMIIQDKIRESEKLFSESGLPSSRSYYSRNIKVNHLNGTTSLIDIELARIQNDITLDPYIKESDEIIVPFDIQNFPKIIISGEVTRPVVLPYKEGDMASHLLKFGYGFTNEANKNDIYLYIPGKSKIKLEVDEKMNLLSDDISLIPGSVIIVGKMVEKTKTTDAGVVSIRGEVLKPGVYPIISGKTSLKQVVEMAGGFEEDAYLPLSKVIRRNDLEQSIIDPRKELNDKFKKSTLVMEDSTRFIFDIMYKQQNLSVNFVDLFQRDDESQNVSLRDGDIIIIPENPERVYVFGQVKNPGFVDYVPNRSMMWYIERAGGFAEGADENRASIIRATNNTWINGYEDDVFVFAGDEIYVPNPPSYPPSVEQQKYSLYVSLVGGFVSILGLIVTIINVSRN
jgi:protein involved in polysaccharide export with SLBB domain